jgi:hypothetical protein
MIVINYSKACTLTKQQLWYLTDNQIFPSTIFNRAHKMKLCSEHRQQGIQLQKSITWKPENQNSCLKALLKDEDAYYETFYRGNNRLSL